jgi:hypothetical protein
MRSPHGAAGERPCRACIAGGRSTTDRLDLLRRKRDQLDAQLRALEARNKQAERKADTRRKVIAGALALEHLEKNRDSEFGRVLFRLLDEYVVRPYDRTLFSFLPEHRMPCPMRMLLPPPNSPGLRARLPPEPPPPLPDRRRSKLASAGRVHRPAGGSLPPPAPR